jgi:integrase
MLTKCPECELQVSTLAQTCPHCGYPLTKEKKISKPKPKRMRLPNGFGSIYEIKNRPLRNPFYVKVCTGRTETGKLKYKALKPQSSFATYQEAYEALIAYNKDPYVFDNSMTVKEVYEAWLEEVTEKRLKNNLKMYKGAWKYCYITYDMDFRNVKVSHIKACLEDSKIKMESGRYAGKEIGPTDATRRTIKSLWNVLFDYAVEHGLVDKNIARTCVVRVKPKRERTPGHIAFTDTEMELLWKASDVDKYACMLLILCYSGMRPSELCELRRKNIDLVNDSMIGGSKTEAGRDRTIPIHHRIKPFIQKFYRESEDVQSEYLINRIDPLTKQASRLKYETLKYRFDKIVEALKLNSAHNPHDCRKHFVTQAKKYQLDEYALKRIIGHHIEDLTERIYTERPIGWLKEEIEKIP